MSQVLDKIVMDKAVAGVAGETLVSKTKGDKCEPTTKAKKKQDKVENIIIVYLDLMARK